jgi:hypothetical protein
MTEHWAGHIVSIELFRGGQQLAHIQIGDLALRAVVPRARKVRPGQPIEIGLHVDEIMICETDAAQQVQSAGIDSARPDPDVRVPGSIMQDQASGTIHKVMVRLTPRMQLEIPVPRWQHRRLRIAVGQSITLSLPLEAVHLFETDECLDSMEDEAEQTSL